MAVRKPKAAEPAPAPVPAAPPVPAFGAYRIEQLGPCRCRYPTASSGDQHRFCGKPTEPGPGNRHGSWCDEHLAVAIVPYQRGGGVVRKAERA